jgi:hypothetical protein
MAGAFLMLILKGGKLCHAVRSERRKQQIIFGGPPATACRIGGDGTFVPEMRHDPAVLSDFWTMRLVQRSDENPYNQGGFPVLSGP